MIAQIAVTTRSSFIALPFLIVLIVVAVVLLTRWGRTRSLRRRPRRRHIVTRIVCATLGLAVLIAVGVSTYRDVNAVYTTDVESQTVSVPTLDPPRAPELQKGEFSKDVDEGALLLHFVFVDPMTSTPVHVETLEADLSQPETPSFTRKINVAGYAVSLSCNVVEVSWQRGPSESGAPVLRMQGSTALNWRGGGSTGSRASSGLMKPGYFTSIGRGDLGPYNPLSIVRRPHGRLNVIRLVSRVAEDDPLQEVTLNAFAEAHADEIAALMSGGDQVYTQVPSRHPGEVPGIAMIARFGPVCLLLLAAAILFAQLFVSRPLAFAGMVAVMVLYVAALDRAVLSANLSCLADTEMPVTSRILAARNARRTFFYAETAKEKYAALAADADEPEPLRRAVKDLNTPVLWWGTDSRSRPVRTPFPPPEREYPETTP